MAWTKVGSLRKGKSGGNYIKVDTDVNLKKGQTLSLQDPRKSLENAVANGRMDEAKAEALKAKIPEYIKYDVVLVPDKA